MEVKSILATPLPIAIPLNAATLRADAQHIREQYLASDACKLIKRLRVFELTVKVFRANYADWQRVINQYRPESPLAALQMMQRPKPWLEPFLVQLTQVLHNFLASAFTLVDHTRNLYNELYSKNGSIPDYQSRVAADFATDGLAAFIKDLRNFCIHYTLPLVGVRLGIHSNINTGTTTNWGVPLSSEKLIAWKGWTAASKKYIGTVGETLNLDGVITSYKEKVENFQQWFQEQQRRVHKAEYDFQFATRFESDRRIELARFHEVVSVLLEGQTHGFSDEELRSPAHEIYEDECRLQDRQVDGNDLEHWFRSIGRLTILKEQEQEMLRQHS